MTDDLDAILLRRLIPFVEVTVEDLGIGSYEFHGQRDNHVAICGVLVAEEAEIDVTDLEYDDAPWLRLEAYAREDEAGEYPVFVVAEPCEKVTRGTQTFQVYQLEREG